MKTSTSQAALPVFLQISENTVVLASPMSAWQMGAAKVFGVPLLESGASCGTPVIRQDPVSQKIYGIY